MLVRCDLDIPEKDDTRLKGLIPTLVFLIENEAKIILIGHRGRPDGKIDGKLSLEPVSGLLSELVGKSIRFVWDISGVETEHEAERIGSDEIIMLENLRFDSREEKNDPEFAKRLASFGEIYVNECFADSHREHASIVGIPKFLPHAAGFQFTREIENLNKVLENPERPVVVVIGGAKSDKKKYVEKLLSHADWVLVGGLLPRLVKSYCRPDGKICVCTACLLPSEKDIDATSAGNFSKILSQAGTIVWNGPMGEYENPEFSRGTEMIARAIASSKALKIVGGGDTLAALQSFGILDKMDWVSSGGGSMLEFLAEGDLAGLKALRA